MYNLNYLYFRENKKSGVELDFHYNQQFNHSIGNCCWHLCCDDISKGETKTCCAYRMHELFAYVPCMEKLELNFFLFAANSISSKKQPNKHNFEISQVDAVLHPEFFWAYRYMYWDQDFNESIGESTVKHTDRLTKVMALFSCFLMPNN